MKKFLFSPLLLLGLSLPSFGAETEETFEELITAFIDKKKAQEGQEHIKFQYEDETKDLATLVGLFEKARFLSAQTNKIKNEEDKDSIERIRSFFEGFRIHLITEKINFRQALHAGNAKEDRMQIFLRSVNTSLIETFEVLKESSFSELERSLLTLKEKYTRPLRVRRPSRLDFSVIDHHDHTVVPPFFNREGRSFFRDETSLEKEEIEEVEKEKS